MSRENEDSLTSRTGKMMAAISVLALTSVLGWTVWTLPPFSDRMQRLVASNMAISGVENPVTAVLLNFRGYDTLLEIGVLLLAALGVFSAVPSPVFSLNQPRHRFSTYFYGCCCLLSFLLADIFSGSVNTRREERSRPVLFWRQAASCCQPQQSPLIDLRLKPCRSPWESVW